MKQPLTILRPLLFAAGLLLFGAAAIASDGNLGQAGDIPVRGDFDGDGVQDNAVYRPTTGHWYITYSSTGVAHDVKWGELGDIPVPADYDGDGITDIAIFRNGLWMILNSAGVEANKTFGAAGDIPAPADYDGDGKADLAVFRPSTSTYFVLHSSDGREQAVTSYGAPGDIPVPADYDGDGKADIALFRPGTPAVWFIIDSSSGAQDWRYYGARGDKPVPADYDGDGKVDVAVYRPGNGSTTSTWFISRSSDGVQDVIPYGDSADIPMAGNYLMHGRVSLSVWRPSAGYWFAQASSVAPAFAENSEENALHQIWTQEMSVAAQAQIRLLNTTPGSPNNGGLSNNRNGWNDIVYQRVTDILIADGIANHDLTSINDALNAMRDAFRHQLSSGGFPSTAIVDGKPITPIASAREVGFFAASLGHGLMLLKNSKWFQSSPHTASLRATLESLNSRIDLALSYLINSENSVSALSSDNQCANRVFVYANAFYLNALYLGRSDGIKIGQKLLDQALAMQINGAFTESGGFDSSYQNVSLFYAEALLYSLPVSAQSEKLRNAIELGMARELESISAFGRISVIGNTRVLCTTAVLGIIKAPDIFNANRALAYYATLFSATPDQSWREARRVFAYYSVHGACD